MWKFDKEKTDRRISLLNEYYPGGYHIVCLETGEYINIVGYVPTSEIDEYVYKTDIVCWVNKDKIDELLELTMK